MFSADNYGMEPEEWDDEPCRPLRLYFVDAAPAWSAAVVVPTLNERGSIGRLLDDILSAHPNLHIVIVDDGSTDGTREYVREWEGDGGPDAPGMGCVHLLTRDGKRGYASAVQDGMRFALERGAPFILQMDADGSHAPRYLPALLEAAATHDLVIGSRYVPGGGTCNWHWTRRVLSRAGSAFAHLLLRLPAHDCTGGFRCWRAETLVQSGILDAPLDGFAFQFAALDRARRLGAAVAEVPITFADRTEGRSKMSGRIVWEGVKVLASLWAERMVAGKTEISPAPSVLPAAPQETSRRVA